MMRAIMQQVCSEVSALLVRPQGFEPRTYRLENGCSDPLSYGRMCGAASRNRTPDQRVTRTLLYH